jgi:HAD superfamily hydrolase (TIGR01509 family)
VSAVPKPVLEPPELLAGDWVPRAVVFDCDGLLVDTESCWALAEAELFGRRGRALSEAEDLELIGMSIPKTIVYLAERLGGQIEPEALEAELLALVATVVAREAGPMPGARALVEQIATAVPVAVASNSYRLQLEAALAAGGFDGRFRISVAGDEIPEPKPAPDVYLAACEKIGVPPAECLAFEDSLPGVAAALSAGLRVVAVPSLAGPDTGAHLTVDSLTDPRLLAWIASWPRAGRQRRSRAQ